MDILTNGMTSFSSTAEDASDNATNGKTKASESGEDGKDSQPSSDSKNGDKKDDKKDAAGTKTSTYDGDSKKSEDDHPKVVVPSTPIEDTKPVVKPKPTPITHKPIDKN